MSPPPTSRPRPKRKPGRSGHPATRAPTPLDPLHEAAEAAEASEAVAAPEDPDPAADVDPGWLDVRLDGPHRAGFVALVGRPNVGKSTLLNALLGLKMQATTSRPQTTRRRFRGVLSLAGAQVVLVDTPGLFDGAVLPELGQGGFGELGAFMAKEARSAVGDVDAVVWVEEAVAPREAGTAVPVTPVQRAVAALLQQSGKPVVLALNKVDTVSKSALLPALASWGQVMDFAAMVPISAVARDGLDDLLRQTATLLPAGPALFPTTDMTDATEREIAAELIREKVMALTGEEVPYAAAVEVDRFDESAREGGAKRPLVQIDATIHVERDGQKAIVVGAGGRKIKEIGIRARGSLERLLGCQVMLRLHVKVSEKWSRSKRGLKALGYV